MKNVKSAVVKLMNLDYIGVILAGEVKGRLRLQFLIIHVFFTRITFPVMI